jgi:Tol biopolymer transport system component/class 3 adenylate cyclase
MVPHDGTEVPFKRKLEVGHVLFMDLVGYSRLTIEDEEQILEELQNVVRELGEFRAASEEKRLIRLPTGDGMALVFFGDPEAPLRAAVELSRGLRDRPSLKLRMGIHSGPVYRVEDINANMNVAGGGVNLAQRVMDCGDAGHILVSEDSARFFGQVGEWADRLHDVGRTRVKHGVRLHLYSLHVSEVGNPALPRKLRRERFRRRGIASAVGAGVAAAAAVLLWIRLVGPPASPTPLPSPVTTNSVKHPLSAAAISPNGQYLAYVEPRGIYVRDIQSGIDKPLPTPEGSALSSPDWELAWFPDSSRLLVSGPTGGEKLESLWLFHLLVGPPQRIAEKAEFPSVAPDDRIAYIDAETESTIWALLPESGGRKRILDAPKGNFFGAICWSPTGGRLGFLELAPENGFIGTVTVDAAGIGANQTTVFKGEDLVSGPGAEEFSGLVWPANDQIVFVRANPPRSKGSNLWKIPVDSKSGKSIGPEKQITNQVDVYLSDPSSTKDGKSLAYLRTKSHSEVYLGNLDSTRKSLTKVGEFISEDSNNWASSWTSDSKSILFTSDRNRGTENIFLQLVNNGEAASLAASGNTQADATALSDGTILFWSWPIDERVNPKTTLMLLPQAGGAPVSLLGSQAYKSQFRCATALPTCLISDESQDKLDFSLLDIQARTKKFLTALNLRVTDAYDWDLSPDGRTVAVVHSDLSDNTVRILTLADGVTLSVRVPSWSGFDNVQWTPDGTGLYLAANLPKIAALLRIDLKGDVDVVWQSESVMSVRLPLPSPDGKYMAFTVTSTGESNAWWIEHF